MAASTKTTFLACVIISLSQVFGSSRIRRQSEIDSYPRYAAVPETSFSCDERGPGYFADVDAQCQVFHVCHDRESYSFLCPNGTLFNQQVFVCDWWYNVNCEDSPQFYGLNSAIGVPDAQFSVLNPLSGESGRNFIRDRRVLPSITGSSGAISYTDAADGRLRVSSSSSSQRRGKQLRGFDSDAAGNSLLSPASLFIEEPRFQDEQLIASTSDYSRPSLPVQDFSNSLSQPQSADGDGLGNTIWPGPGTNLGFQIDAPSTVQPVISRPTYLPKTRTYGERRSQETSESPRKQSDIDGNQEAQRQRNNKNYLPDTKKTTQLEISESGRNSLSQGNGRDYLSQGNGRDYLSQGNGRDYLSQGNGRDYLSQGNGRDYLSQGNDIRGELQIRGDGDYLSDVDRSPNGIDSSIGAALENAFSGLTLFPEGIATDSATPMPPVNMLPLSNQPAAPGPGERLPITTESYGVLQEEFFPSEQPRTTKPPPRTASVRPRTQQRFQSTPKLRTRPATSTTSRPLQRQRGRVRFNTQQAESQNDTLATRLNNNGGFTRGRFSGGRPSTRQPPVSVFRSTPEQRTSRPRTSVTTAKPLKLKPTPAISSPPQDFRYNFQKIKDKIQEKLQDSASFDVPAIQQKAKTSGSVSSSSGYTGSNEIPIPAAQWLYFISDV